MKTRMLMIFLTLFFSVSFSHANSNLFYPYIVFPTGSSPEAVAIGDVNGDGRNDVVITTSHDFDPENDFRIHVFLQNALGYLDPPIKYQTNSSTSNRPTSIDIGDVNHDGRADVVVGNSGSNIEVFLQNADGGLNPGISYPTDNSLSIKIADLNNDGLLDVVGIGWGTDTVDVILQNSNGGLNPPVTYDVIHGGYDEVDVGDVNNDGLTDIIVMSGQGYSPNLGVLLQQLNGSFSAPVYHDLGVDENADGVAVGDVNSDALQDVVVTSTWDVRVFLQSQTGTLQPAIRYDSYVSPEPVVIADVNNDGRQDVILAHGGEALGVYLQGTNGSLLPEELYPLPYATHYFPQALAVGDINQDGLNDVVVANYNYGLVVLYSVSELETISPPTVPNGPNTVPINVSHTYSTGGSLSDKDHPIQYLFDWGDGTNSGWLPVGTTSASKSWYKTDTFIVKAQARCATHPWAVSTPSEGLTVTIVSPFTLLTPLDSEIFNSCSLIAGYQPSFTWAATETFASYTILFSISPPDFTTPGVLIRKASVRGPTNSLTPSSSVWKKVMTSGSQHGNIYWKLIGTRSDRTTSESDIRSFRIDRPQYVTINAPLEHTLPWTPPSTFDFNTTCNVKFKLEISSVFDFSDPKKIESFNYTTRDPNIEQKLVKTLSFYQWNAVKKLIGREMGLFRIKAWDTMNRETVSSPQPFNILSSFIGTWDIRGTEIVIFTYKDGEISRRPAAFGDEFTFSPDGTFQMVQFTGTWDQQGSAFEVYLLSEEIERFFEFHFERQGYIVDVTRSSTSFTGKENMNDTISGKLSMAVDLSHDYNDVPIKINLDATFTGRRNQETPISALEESLSQKATSIFATVASDLNTMLKTNRSHPLE